MVRAYIWIMTKENESYCSGLGLRVRHITPIVRNQTEKTIENDLESGTIFRVLGFGFGAFKAKCWVNGFEVKGFRSA